ncbi:hypothetical protein SLE2022_397530 [Rubroshorea leprosula]
MVAVMKSIALITSIQERLDVDGGLITISPLGGQRALLLERVKAYLEESIRNNRELIDLWFEMLQPWALSSQMSNKMVWLHISGVSLKAWSKRCFNEIASTMGGVLLIHKDMKKKSILCDGKS